MIMHTRKICRSSTLPRATMRALLRTLAQPRAVHGFRVRCFHGGKPSVAAPRHTVPRVLVLGPPGAGKSTICRRLAERYGCPHVSTGDLLRAEVASNSDIGQKAKAIMEQGGLVPDVLMRRALAARLTAEDTWQRGWIGDGWVREPVNAESVVRIDRPRVVFHLTVPRDVALARLGHRRGDGAAPARRDDEEAAVERRLDAFDAHQDGAIAALEAAGVQVITIDTDGSLDVVDSRVDAVWQSCFGGGWGVTGGTPATGPVADLGGDGGVVRVLDSEAWWETVHGLKTKDRLRDLLREAGVGFWEGDYNYVREPTVSLVAIGGIPLRLTPHSGARGWVELGVGARGHGPVVSLSDLASSLRVAMGLASFPSYLNPKDASPSRMFDIIADHGHFSVGHVPSVSFMLCGHSCAVENELNSQRDIVHLARLTVARTAAQADPPLVVPHETLLPTYRAIRKHTTSVLRDTAGKAARPSGVSVGDWQEGRFTAFPAAKAQLIQITGSLRNLQKLVGDLHATGKEREYRVALRHMNDVLHALLPDMFPASDQP